jgi:hypothetical protein
MSKKKIESTQKLKEFPPVSSGYLRVGKQDEKNADNLHKKPYFRFLSKEEVDEWRKSSKQGKTGTDRIKNKGKRVKQ